MKFRIKDLNILKFKIESLLEIKDNCWHLKNKSRRRGYPVICYNRRSFIASRISYYIFKGNPKNKLVLHTCDNRECINPEHLYLGSIADNMQDKADRNRMKGKMWNTKLTQEQVIAIRNSTEIHREIALNFGVSISLVGLIKNRKRWGWL